MKLLDKAVYHKNVYSGGTMHSFKTEIDCNYDKRYWTSTNLMKFSGFLLNIYRFVH